MRAAGSASCAAKHCSSSNMLYPSCSQKMSGGSRVFASLPQLPSPVTTKHKKKSDGVKTNKEARNPFDFNKDCCVEAYPTNGQAGRHEDFLVMKGVCEIFACLGTLLRAPRPAPCQPPFRSTTPSCGERTKAEKWRRKGDVPVACQQKFEIFGHLCFPLFCAPKRHRLSQQRVCVQFVQNSKKRKRSVAAVQTCRGSLQSLGEPLPAARAVHPRAEQAETCAGCLRQKIPLGRRGR